MRLRYSRVLEAARRTEGAAPLPALAVRFAAGATVDFAAGAEDLVEVRAVGPLVLAVAFAAGTVLDFAIVGRLVVATEAVVLAGVRAAEPLVPLDLPAVLDPCGFCEVLAERGAWAPGRRAAPLPFFAIYDDPPDEVRRGPVYRRAATSATPRDF